MIELCFCIYFKALRSNHEPHTIFIFTNCAGPEFEHRILANEANNAKFNFLKPGDPYNAYYQHKIKQIKGDIDVAAGENGAPTTAPAAASPPLLPAAAVAPKAPILPPTKPVEPPAEEQYTVNVPEGLTVLDLDVIKLTAQFVARNGKTFLTGLAAREHTNPQFNFLKPTHSLFSFFTRLCDAYSLVLMPPKGVVASLQGDVEDRAAPLQRALNRLEFERTKEREAKDTANEDEAERLALLSIDWHDFVVVETINFEEGEEAALPAPVTKKEILQLARAAAYQDKEDAKEAAENGGGGGGGVAVTMDAEEQALVAQAATTTTTAAPLLSSAPLTATAGTGEGSGDVDMDVSDEDEDAAAPMRVVKNYVRQDHRAVAAAAAGYDPNKYVVSVITGELVPIEEMAEHMRVSLIDPKWRLQKDIMLSKIKETTKASDDEIGRNLSLLARTRPDVFGADKTAVSAALEKQIQKEREGLKGAGGGTMAPPAFIPPPAAVPPVTAAAAMPPPSMPPPPPSQFAHGQQNLAICTMGPPQVPPPQPPPPPHMPPPPPPPSTAAAANNNNNGDSDEEQEAKRRRLDPANLVLIPESEFIESHPGAATIQIQCPVVTGNEKLTGQILSIEIDSLRESVSAVKKKISKATGAAVNKLRLSRESVGILVDALSLGHYNVGFDVKLQLSLKERGGKKK